MKKIFILYMLVLEPAFAASITQVSIGADFLGSTAFGWTANDTYTVGELIWPSHHSFTVAGSVNTYLTDARIISACSSTRFTSMGTFAKHLAAPTQTGNYCWCKMIRPYATQWFPEKTGADTSADLDSCMYNCAYACKASILEKQTLGVYLFTEMNKWMTYRGSDIEDQMFPDEAPSGLGGLAIERQGLIFRDYDASSYGTCRTSLRTAPACEEVTHLSDAALGTCWRYSRAGNVYSDDVGTYLYSAPCNE